MEINIMVTRANGEIRQFSGDSPTEAESWLIENSSGEGSINVTVEADDDAYSVLAALREQEQGG